jgi:asparagine synthetase B (glutamine-hydrolysing)
MECRLPAYTYGLEESSDVRRAVALANQTKIPHTLLPLGEDYLARLAEPAVSRMEGMANCLDSHGLVLNQIRPNQEILMLGNGGDSFFLAFRAYRRKLLELSGDPVDDFYTATAAPFDEAGLVELFTPEFHNRMAGLVRENLRASFAEMQNNSLDNLYDAHRLREFNRRGLLQGLATTNTHLEFVEPYYDYDLVDFALSLPVEQRWERRLPKQTLAVLAPRLARVEGGPLEPKWTAKRIGTAARARLSRVFPKPVSGWLKPGRQASFTFSDLNQLMASGKNLEWAASILLDRRTAERGMYRPEIVRRLLSEQANGKPGHARRLGALLTFELWQRQFLEA